MTANPDNYGEPCTCVGFRSTYTRGDGLATTECRKCGAKWQRKYEVTHPARDRLTWLAP